MFLCSLLAAVSLYSTLSIDSWFISDTDVPRYDKFRIEEVVLSGNNPVYTNDDEFDGYKDVSVFSAAFDDSVLPNGVVLILQSTTDDEDEDYSGLENLES